jgi:hypothetical protein
MLAGGVGPIRRSESRVVRRAGADDGAGRPLRAWGTAGRRLRIAAAGGANAAAKVLALVAGMIAGADSIDDMELLRHGGMVRLFTDVRAPSTLGTFLRCFGFGHVRQLDAVAARLLAAPDTLAQDLYVAEATAGGFLLHGMSVAIDMSEGGS